MFGVTADTNIFISALVFGGGPGRFLEAARRGLFRLDLSPAILAETLRVLAEKFDWSQPMLDLAEHRLTEIAILALPAISIDAVPADPDDNRVLECAVAAGSRYIVSGDGDLLGLGSYESIRILRVSDFLAMLQEPQP